jgi:hypothetical protein
VSNSPNPGLLSDLKARGKESDVNFICNYGDHAKLGRWSKMCQGAKLDKPSKDDSLHSMASD